MTSLRIAQVAPVARRIRSSQSDPVEQFTAILTDGLVEDGHTVTLFAVDNSETRAALHATFPHGYREEPTGSADWGLREIFNLTAAVERAADFDVIHHHPVYWPMSLGFSRLTSVPIVQTMHRTPHPDEVTLWRRFPEAPYVAMSEHQAELLRGLNIMAMIHCGVDPRVLTFGAVPDDYCLYLGPFTPAEGVLHAIDVARRVGKRLVLSGPDDESYRSTVAPHVDGRTIVYAGEVDHKTRAALLRAAQVLLCPVESPNLVDLLLVEALTCGTPVAALDRGAVREIVTDGVTGYVFASVDTMAAGLPSVLALDRHRVRAHAVERFSSQMMVTRYVDVYRQLVGSSRVPRA